VSAAVDLVVVALLPNRSLLHYWCTDGSYMYAHTHANTHTHSRFWYTHTHAHTHTHTQVKEVFAAKAAMLI